MRNRTVESSDPHNQRLQKVLAAAGWGSRRECEELIESGRVEIDRHIVVELGTRVDPDTQSIHVDGELVQLDKRQYFMVNKPDGIVSTNKDPAGRTRVIDLIDTQQRVYTVGRLDKASEGLIIVTNDGDLANRLTHPRYGVTKTYHVQVVGLPKLGMLRELEQGIHLAEGVARVRSIKIRKKSKNTTDLEMILDEGRNREIRRLLAKIGHKVTKLKRVSIGPVRLGDLPSGAHRELTKAEIRELKSSVTKPIPRAQRGTSDGKPRSVRSKSNRFSPEMISPEALEAAERRAKELKKREEKKQGLGTKAAQGGKRPTKKKSSSKTKVGGKKKTSSRKSSVNKMSANKTSANKTSAKKSRSKVNRKR